MNNRRLISFVLCGFTCLAVIAAISMMAAIAIPNFIGPYDIGGAGLARGVFVSAWNVVAAAIVCVTVFLMFMGVMLLRVVRKRDGSRTLTDQEGATLEELWDGFQKMEDRMINLETILLNRERERDFESRL